MMASPTTGLSTANFLHVLKINCEAYINCLSEVMMTIDRYEVVFGYLSTHI